MGNGKRKTGNQKWEIVNCKFEIVNAELTYPNQLPSLLTPNMKEPRVKRS